MTTPKKIQKMAKKTFTTQKRRSSTLKKWSHILYEEKNEMEKNSIHIFITQ